MEILRRRLSALLGAAAARRSSRTPSSTRYSSATGGAWKRPMDHPTRKPQPPGTTPKATWHNCGFMCRNGRAGVRCSTPTVAVIGFCLAAHLIRRTAGADRRVPGAGVALARRPPTAIGKGPATTRARRSSDRRRSGRLDFERRDTPAARLGVNQSGCPTRPRRRPILRPAGASACRILREKNPFLQSNWPTKNVSLIEAHHGITGRTPHDPASAPFGRHRRRLTGALASRRAPRQPAAGHLLPFDVRPRSRSSPGQGFLASQRAPSPTVFLLEVREPPRGRAARRDRPADLPWATPLGSG